MKLLRYFAVGGAAATVDIGLFVIFAKLVGFNYLWVAASSFAIATFVNYMLSVRFVFSSGVRFSRANEFFLVYLVSGMGLLVNQAVLYTGIDLFMLEMVLSKCIATGVVFFWNYFARAYFVFRPPSVAPSEVNHAGTSDRRGGLSG